MKKVAFLLSALILGLTVSASASYCTYCGKGFNDSANFCSNCGTRLYKQTSNTVITNNGNTTTKSTTTYICPNNSNSTITYTTTTPGYTYTTSSGNTQVIYTNPPVVAPTYVYPTTSSVVYRTEPTFGEILIGGVLAHQIFRHHHHHHVHRPAPVIHRYGPRPHHR